MSIYLYIKTHNKTGLKYLGKTVQKDPHKYPGSGKFWTNHLNKHGYDYTTEILRECQSNSELQEWGLYYSNLYDIVNAKDETGKKIWANLKPEYGDGDDPENIRKKHYLESLKEDIIFQETATLMHAVLQKELIIY